MFADVVFPISVDKPFTYAVPEAHRAAIALGMRVLAPWRNAQKTGYVVGLHETCALENVKPLHHILDETPLFTPEMLRLAKWLAEYYCCGWGEALQCAVPAGVNLVRKITYTLLPDAIHAGRFTDIQKAVIAELYKRGPLTEGQLAKAVGKKGLSSALAALSRRNVLLAEEEAPQAGVSIHTISWIELVEENVPPQEVLAQLQRRSPRQAAVYLDLLHYEPERPTSQLYERHRIDATALRALEKKGLVRWTEREALRIPQIDADRNSAIKLTLNGEQQSAFNAMTAAMDAGTFQTFLLKGITGSGKTEVYLQAIEHALASGKTAIILVPEISLTPQTVGRFKARFAEDIAVLHSGLGKGERYDEWRRAQRGEVRIVVGARSAVFAPLRNLGIIVVDEEHDTSYKQGETPRYHARDVAIMRAHLSRAVCVLGSATPSVESFYNSERGKSIRLDLKKRAANALLPTVRIVDMREEAKEVGAAAILSRALEAAVAERIDAREQVILMLNRRGFSPFVLCPACGWVAECTDCNVTLTFHQKGGYLLCHYCNGQQPLAQQCGECGNRSLQYIGHGTQKVEEYLQRAFPEARVERMDADTTAGKGGHAQILGRFANQEIDILVGTQMIAKGHDYPGVTLVGVINGDTGLGVCDFRAAENTFQLLTQVSGRAGRGAKPGDVYIQTFRPKHYAIQCAAAHDYAAFYEREIAERRKAGYPPLRRMANLLVEGEDPLHVERAALLAGRIAREQIETLGLSRIQVLGPAPASVKRVQKKYRWNVALLSNSVKNVNAVTRAARAVFESGGAPPGTTLKVDLDPYGQF